MYNTRVNAKKEKAHLKKKLPTNFLILTDIIQKHQITDKTLKSKSTTSSKKHWLT